MTDIPQWRRKIPAARSRTPLLPEPEHESRPPSAAGLAHPPTPKRGLRPKLSSYLSHNGPFGTLPRTEPDIAPNDFTPSKFPSWAVEDPFPNPSADQLITSLMCRLMSGPYDALEPRFNGALLHIFEAYRNVVDERDILKEKLDKEVDERYAERYALNHTEQGWEEEIETYKAEVKRLEVIIAQGKRGVADVALARQESFVRRKLMESPEDDTEDDGKETVFQFLEKTRRRDDPAWSNQRATMKNRAASPSAKMARLSRKLTKKTSMTSIHADLPFGTPPELPRTASLQKAFQDDQCGNSETQKREVPTRNLAKPQPAGVTTSLSDDSAFSCAGDFLPDEICVPEARTSNESVASPLENDMLDIKQLAMAISRKRNLFEGDMLPRLLQLFDELSLKRDMPEELHRGNTRQLPQVTQRPTAKKGHTGPVRKPSHIKGLLSRLRPQLNQDNAALADRRFSFEFGDDISPILDRQQCVGPHTSRESLLRKSVSLSSLSDRARKNHAASNAGQLSPISHSPTESTTETGSRRSSKIPSPTYKAANLAKPRQQRDDSMSSLLTAIRHDDYPSQRTSSMGSSVYSTPSATRSKARTTRESSNSSWGESARHHASRLTGDTSNVMQGQNVSHANHADNAPVPLRIETELATSSSASIRSGSVSRSRHACVERMKENARPLHSQSMPKCNDGDDYSNNGGSAS